MDRVSCSASRFLWASVLGVMLAGVAPVAMADAKKAAAEEEPQAVHAIALHGEPKYGPDFKHVDYVNPDAPKGGNITVAVIGTFDSLNPYIVKGLPASGLALLYETLLEKTQDEPLTSYGLLAKKIKVAEDRSWVSFTLRNHAQWQDGKPVTVEDVIWSFTTLMKHGQPFYRSYYSAVKNVEAVGPRTVKFTFKKANNRELPLIVGDMPILPKHYWTSKGHDFSRTTLTPPIGTGPYKIKSVEPGRRIVFERVKDWWGEDLPINKGRYNFDTITFDYYRDPGVAFQAFLAGAVDFRQENIAKNWAQGYNHPAVRKELIKREEIKQGLPSGMQAFIYNTRRPIFKDPLVREALAYAFDFEWSNKQLAFGSYVRSNSYFSNSELAATMPISDEEKALLQPFADKLPSRVFTNVYQPPKTNGSGDARQNLRHAAQLLREAGWVMDKGVLKNEQGKNFEFEIMLDSPMFDRWLLPFVANLKKLGIVAKIREIDVSQYQNRVNDFDFDMTITTIPQSLTPGNEQYAFFGSETADTPGSQNFAGINNPIVDELIEKIVHATSREELITATRAMDRVLLWNFYVIPQWYSDKFRIAYWSKLGQPAENPPFGLPILETWWVKPGAAPNVVTPLPAAAAPSGGAKNK